MKYKTLFRMMLKAIGVWVFVGGINSLTGQIGMLGFYLANQSIGRGQVWYFFLNVIAPLVQFGVGAYLFFGGKWIVDRAIPGNRPYCHECGYDLTNAAGNLCTECGTPFKPTETSPAP